jgi:lipopolysaccharide transport system permease protein
MVRGVSVSVGLLASIPLRMLAVMSPRSLYIGAEGGVQSVIKNLPLAATLARRELSRRHAGQFLGAIWAIGQPLFLMLLFLFIFGIVFKQRMGGTVELPRDYAVYILSGLVPWLSFQPTLITTCTSITGNGNLIKQFTIDSAVFPLKDVLVTFVFWAVGIAVVLFYTLAIFRSLPWTLLLLPVAAVIQFVTAIGFGWALASLSVFVRDIREVMQIATTAGIYILPIVYLPNWVPPLFRPFLYLNPFSYLIWVYQDTLYFGRLEHPWAWVMAAGVAALSFILGSRAFRRMKPYFAAYL